MKKILFAALFLISGMFTMNAQNISIVEGPDYIYEVTRNAMFVTGVTDNGKYCWGNNKTSAFYYDTEEGIFNIIKVNAEEKKKGYLETKIAGITDEGLIVVSYGKRECYVWNPATDEKNYIKSPLTDFPYFVPWDITPDAKYVVGNCIAKGNDQRPSLAVLQDDGTYKVTVFDYDPYDAMGAPAQFTQARAITKDGKYIAGPQVSETGFVSRYVTWELNADGVYEFKTPYDDILYDFTQEKPGVQPVYYDYVTETDRESEEYKEQRAEFDKAMDEYWAKLQKFTRNYTNIDWASVRTSSHGNYMCGTFKVLLGENNNKYSPIFYNFDKQEIILLDSLPASSKGWDVFPEEQFLSLTSPDSLKNFDFKTMISENGVRIPFHEWIEKKTGTDISEFYHDIFIDTFGSGKEYEDIYMGNVIMSRDGKTMVTSTWMNGRYETSMIKFSESLFGNVSTGIELEVVSNTKMNGSVINASSATVDVYTFDGMKVNTFNVAGCIDLANELSTGSYIVKVTEGKSVRSYKLVIR